MGRHLAAIDGACVAQGLFEEGVALARRCSDLLNQAERKIELLVEQGDGTWSLRPLDEGSHLRYCTVLRRVGRG